MATACAVALTLSFGIRRAAMAKDYPSRAIELVVAAPAGGPSDALARMLAEDMSKRLGQPIVVVNRPGAGGTIAAGSVARAVPDGHTLMLSWIGNATSGSLLPKVSVDIHRDFVHITQVASGANILAVHPKSGFRSLPQLIAFARAHPGRLSYASAGNGSSGHLAMELLKQRARIFLVHVPYRGGAPALNDLMGGQVDLMFINQDVLLGTGSAGKLMPLAISSSRRHHRLPMLPTVSESGFPGFEAMAWSGLSAPYGTPASIVERLHAAAVAALQGPLKGKLEALGLQVVGSTPSQYTTFMISEVAKWARVIQAAGIKAD
jgi:tripartite-type tricarboxylate transporter receptor subunit TctC